MVVFVIGNEEINLPLSEQEINSELIRDLVRQNGQETMIHVPEKYQDVISDYINFLQNEDIWKCLANRLSMAIFFEDDKYFNFLLQQAYDNWSSFKDYVEGLADETQWEIYLHIPYEFVPKKFMDDASFYKKWIELNKNKEIILNGNEVYHTKVEYYPKFRNAIKSVVIYHTINGEEIGYKQINEYYKDGTPLEYKQFMNGKENGVWLEWYSNGQLFSRKYYDKGVKNGEFESWWPNGQIKSRSFYDHGQLSGPSMLWSEDGQLEQEEYYENGQPHGLYRMWYQNGKPMYEGENINGKREGLWKDWEWSGERYRLTETLYKNDEPVWSNTQIHND